MQFAPGTHERVHPQRGRCWYCGDVCGVLEAVKKRYLRYRLFLLRHFLDKLG